MASVADAPGHVVAPPAPLTPALALCANGFTTSPRTAQTSPLVRGNAVDDAHFADVRRGTGRSRHAHSIASPEPAEVLRRAPPLQCTPGDATATRRFVVIDNLLTHTAHPRWSLGEPVDPLPAPPVASPLAGDDDGRVPFDPLLIMEPTNVKFYQLGNGGDLIFERDLDALSDFLGRPHPEFHEVEVHDQQGGELQWTQKELDNSRAYANQTHMALAHHADAIKLLAKDHKSLRIQRAKKDATIVRLRAKIASLEATVKAQEDQLNEMDEDGEDIQGGEDFLSDDDDFEEDEFTDEEDYEFLEAAEDGIIPIDVDEDDEE
ncbi:hypothetical protein QYE76_042163 [Lolium multiflorum]|uniref:Uncharacterized protein n=1 Tax=Lolium multiflorum TaxID=4521 RepID=A0AAD8WUN6_LOLMU|nr:hypothetical protein QYE76_042163 [Lolium multiflorum]